MLGRVSCYDFNALVCSYAYCISYTLDYHNLEMENKKITKFENKQFNEEHKNDNNSVKLFQDAAHGLVKDIYLNEFLT